MRIYTTFTEALNEIKRDLAEMGIRIHPKTYQDKFVGDNPDFQTLELQNYIFTVVNPDPAHLDPNQPWADAEFQERISGYPLNPGKAWIHRKDVWTEFLTDNGKFAYTYPERLARANQIERIIEILKKDPDTRQAFMAVWDAEDTANFGGISRVPCTIGYQFQIRSGLLHITYLQRSCDFATHMQNDMYLAHQMQRFIAKEVGVEVGYYTHWFGSLHIFAKDARGVF